MNLRDDTPLIRLRDVVIALLIAVAFIGLIVLLPQHQVLGACPAPKDNEQLHLVAVKRGDRIVGVECAYFTSPGEGKRRTK